MHRLRFAVNSIQADTLRRDIIFCSMLTSRIELVHELQTLTLNSIDTDSNENTPIKYQRIRQLSTDLISTPRRYKVLKKRSSVILFVGRGGCMSDGDLNPKVSNRKNRVFKRRLKKDGSVSELSNLLLHLNV